jgi:thioredoxin reductase (NADPH)
MDRMRAQAQRFGADTRFETVIKADLSRRPFQVTTTTDPSGDPSGEHREYTADALIGATGASARWRDDVPTEYPFRGAGVSTCATCDGAFYRNRPIAVVGGGDSAVEEATFLTKFASKVYMVVRRDAMRASKIMAERAQQNPKIEVKWNTVVDELLGNGKQVTGVRLKSTAGKPDETLDVGGMFFAIGHTPNVAFLDGQVGLTPGGNIQWTKVSRTYTTVEGVFAAGDVADDYYRQAISAAGTGCMAALDAERYLGHHGLL